VRLKQARFPRILSFTSIGRAERLAAFLDVGDHEDLGVAGQVVLQRLHDVQVAEAATEGDVLLGRHLQVAEHQERVPGPCRFDRCEGGIVDRQPQTDQLCSELPLQGPDHHSG
jgi:hypothetical protein